MWVFWKYGVEWIHEDQDRDKEVAVLDGNRNFRLPHGESYFLRITANAVLSRNLLLGIATGNNRIFVVQCKCAQMLRPADYLCCGVASYCGPSGWQSRQY
jgi:hypothetical protein